MKLKLETLKSLLPNSFLDYHKENLMGICPWCGVNEFGVSLKDNHTFNCFRKKRCGETGNIYKLLKKLNRLDLLGNNGIESIKYDARLENIIEKSTGDLKEWLVAHRKELELVDKMTQEFMTAVNKSYNRNSRGLFHYSRTGEVAHARRGGNLSWNVDYMKNNNWRSALKDLEKFLGEKGGGKVDNLIESLSTLAHEYGHIVEDIWAWTHDPKHDKEQARILIQFVIQNGPQKILEALKPATA